MSDKQSLPEICDYKQGFNFTAHKVRGLLGTQSNFTVLFKSG